MTHTYEEWERCLLIANETLRQIKACIAPNVFWSWGVSKYSYTFHKDMPTLMLRVSGVLHKGWVYVSLNEGMDVYEIFLYDVSRKKCKNHIDEVYCDGLGRTIDSLVERAPQMTDNEYHTAAMADSRKKTL